MNTIVILFLLASVIRLVSLIKSASNEKKLRKANAVEYGRNNSIVLVFFHTLYYLACLSESIVLHKTVNIISFFGVGLFVFSMVILWIVIFSLKDLWTVKLIIAREHRLNNSFIFRFFRHPNYFLNIIPELISIALICQAWYTLLIGLPLYLIPLTIRIVQEERVMRKHFNNY
ncbi:MAG TPA: isoprenylcysteine carboxylmethyltransferase family protein [Chryseolinea sp.]|nr:isoprenylcysteine carboxylmethyltransferase family protein [Chryseolinea sp.]